MYKWGSRGAGIVSCTDAVGTITCTNDGRLLSGPSTSSGDRQAGKVLLLQPKARQLPFDKLRMREDEELTHVGPGGPALRQAQERVPSPLLAAGVVPL